MAWLMESEERFPHKIAQVIPEKPQSFRLQCLS
jgi:hypothetical protein